jgi:molybdate transport system regulatory protein
MKPEVQFRLRIRNGEDIAVGPGKIELLEAIAHTGSITAAAKLLGMSYRWATALRAIAIRALANCSSSSILAGSRHACHRRCPADSSNASRLHGRWHATRRCC